MGKKRTFTLPFNIIQYLRKVHGTNKEASTSSPQASPDFYLVLMGTQYQMLSLQLYLS